MTQYVFMNHHIREPVPEGPVVVCQHEGVQRESNDFELRFRGIPIGRVRFTRKGLPECETHTVHAWIELDDDIEVVDVTPKAKAKKPNRKVRT